MDQLYLNLIPAVFGLLGVFVGGYFTYLANQKSRHEVKRVEQRNDLRAGLKAARLTALELVYNAGVLIDASERDIRWTDDGVHPAIEAWWEYRSELAMRLDANVWKQVSQSCTEIHTEMWRGDNASASDRVASTDMESLSSIAGRAKAAADALEGASATWEQNERNLT